MQPHMIGYIKKQYMMQFGAQMLSRKNVKDQYVAAAKNLGNYQNDYQNVNRRPPRGGDPRSNRGGHATS